MHSGRVFGTITACHGQNQLEPPGEPDAERKHPRKITHRQGFRQGRAGSRTQGAGHDHPRQGQSDCLGAFLPAGPWPPVDRGPAGPWQDDAGPVAVARARPEFPPHPVHE